MQKPDIDIDLGDRNEILKLIKHVPAMQQVQDSFRKHNSGVYVTEIPTNPITGVASIDYEQAEQRGYIKIDFLNVSIYQLVKDQKHYLKLMSTEPAWSRLWEDTTWTNYPYW